MPQAPRMSYLLCYQLILFRFEIPGDYAVGLVFMIYILLFIAFQLTCIYCTWSWIT